MPQRSIYFHNEDTLFILEKQTEISEWLKQIIEDEEQKLGELNYIFCSDEYLLKMNQEHLNHDYYTDIITFDYCENNVVSGDLFISVERTKENAKTFGKTQINELHRVIAHGLLHLLGFNDKSPDETKEMRRMEEKVLNDRKFT